MPTSRIKAWNYTNYHQAGVQPPDSEQVFDRTLDDQALILDLYEQFNQLRRDVRISNILLSGQKWYQFSFMEDGSLAQLYQGTSYTGAWAVTTDPTDRKKWRSVGTPHDILESLHESIGLPWALPKGHL
jgi:hypothetical protein